MKEYSNQIVISFCVGVFLVLLGTGSSLAQTDQSSKQQSNETGNQSSGGEQQQSQAMPPTDIVAPITNETAEGFASESDVKNLTGLNFGGQQQQGNETGNQSSGGEQQQQQQGNETGNQSSQNPIEQIEEAISDVFGSN